MRFCEDKEGREQQIFSSLEDIVDFELQSHVEKEEAAEKEKPVPTKQEEEWDWTLGGMVQRCER